eukprot:m.16528 g.16528  ORF g.16528 m.16528 type:complete len:390 (+) comp5271_c0_seq1:169-1338(+)
MDIKSLEKEFERVHKRQRTAETATLQGIDGLISSLTRATETDFAEGGEDDGPCIDAWTKLGARVKEQSSKITAAHKELGGYIGKAGKAVDKQSNRASILKHFDADAFKGHPGALNSSVAEHLYRQGRFGIAEHFVKEAALEFSSEQRNSFMEMFAMLQALRKHDANPALEWAQQHRDYLRTSSSPLEFRLRQLCFITLVGQNKTTEATAYAQEHFPRFATEHFSAIKRSMGALLWGGTRSSPYADLFDDAPWREVAQLFSRNCCSFLGLASQSPLAASIEAGCVALPKLLKFISVLEATGSKHEEMMWNKKETLPVEIDIGNAGQYHTVFTCPVSREQSTQLNPPMRLPCGHAICLESLRRLAKGARRRFKCTYCPSEQTLAEATELHF